MSGSEGFPKITSVSWRFFLEEIRQIMLLWYLFSIRVPSWKKSYVSREGKQRLLAIFFKKLKSGPTTHELKEIATTTKFIAISRMVSEMLMSI